MFGARVPMFNIKKKKIHHLMVVTLKGDVVLGECQELETFLVQLQKEGKYCVILDCEDLEGMSTKGMKVILRLSEVFRKSGGDIKMIRVQEKLHNVFRICGLSQMIEIVASLEDGIQKFSSGVGHIEKHLLWKMS